MALLVSCILGGPTWSGRTTTFLVRREQSGATPGPHRSGQGPGPRSEKPAEPAASKWAKAGCGWARDLRWPAL